MKIRPMKELEAFARKGLPQGGSAQSGPVPILDQGTLCAAIFWYRRSFDPRQPSVVYPPYRLLVLDVETAQVLRSMPVAPRDVGPDAPEDQSLPGQGGPQVKTVDEWRALQARIETLAPLVWTAFGEGRSVLDPEEQGNVGEYIELTERSSPLAHVPYYRHIGKSFYEWADRARNPAGETR